MISRVRWIVSRWGIPTLSAGVLTVAPMMTTGAPAGEAAIHAKGKGKLFVMGNMIEGPWTFALVGGRVAYNGYALKSPPPGPARRWTPVQEARLGFIKATFRMSDSLGRLGIGPQEAARILAAHADAAPLGGHTRLENGWVSVVFPDGWAVMFTPGSEPIPAPAPKGPSTIRREDPRVGVLRMIGRSLEAGRLVYISSTSGATFVTTPHVERSLAAIERIKAGGSPGPAEHYFGRDFAEQVRHPWPMERIK
jgi:hypothetical protein